MAGIAIKKRLISILLICLLVASGCATGKDIAVSSQTGEEGGAMWETESLSREGYTLEKVVVLGRHNIRSPLSEKGSLLDTMTPHEWFSWSSDPSDLSLRGGVLETEMGQYFRKWLEEEGLFPDNYIPADGEVRIYANAKQRTIATAGFFAAGLLPVGDPDVETNAEFDTMDPVFHPRLTQMSEEYAKAAEAQIRELFTERIQSLSDNYELLSDVLDIKESPDYKEGVFNGFVTDDTELILKKDEEPALNGSLKSGCQLSDALILQYYEGDEETSAFGKKLSWEDWEDIAEIKDTYQDVLFTAPLISINAAHPLLQEIQSELETEGRKFTFLCGHDSNLGTVLSALDVEDYDLPHAIEKKTPIGCNLVFSVWRGKDGKRYMSADLVYQNAEQLRELTLLDMNTSPAVFHLSFNGLEKSSDGLMAAAEMEERLQGAIDSYDEL